MKARTTEIDNDYRSISYSIVRKMELRELKKDIRSILSNDDCSTLKTQYQATINNQDKVKLLLWLYWFIKLHNTTTSACVPVWPDGAAQSLSVSMP